MADIFALIATHRVMVPRCPAATAPHQPVGRTTGGQRRAPEGNNRISKHCSKIPSVMLFSPVGAHSSNKLVRRTDRWLCQLYPFALAGVDTERRIKNLDASKGLRSSWYPNG